MSSLCCWLGIRPMEWVGFHRHTNRLTKTRIQHWFLDYDMICLGCGDMKLRKENTKIFGALAWMFLSWGQGGGPAISSPASICSSHYFTAVHNCPSPPLHREIGGSRPTDTPPYLSSSLKRRRDHSQELERLHEADFLLTSRSISLIDVFNWFSLCGKLWQRVFLKKSPSSEIGLEGVATPQEQMRMFFDEFFAHKTIEHDILESFLCRRPWQYDSVHDHTKSTQGRKTPTGTYSPICTASQTPKSSAAQPDCGDHFNLVFFSLFELDTPLTVKELSSTQGGLSPTDASKHHFQCFLPHAEMCMMGEYISGGTPRPLEIPVCPSLVCLDQIPLLVELCHRKDRLMVSLCDLCLSVCLSVRPSMDTSRTQNTACLCVSRRLFCSRGSVNPESMMLINFSNALICLQFATDMKGRILFASKLFA